MHPQKKHLLLKRVLSNFCRFSDKDMIYVLGEIKETILKLFGSKVI